MSKLYLLRHAKAGWALPGMKDFDRPLDETGRADAAEVGIAMQARGHMPELTLCSGARRARETLEGLGGHFPAGRVVFLDTLYSEDATGYLEIINRHGAAGSMLIIGHNPMMEDLATAVAKSGEDSARAALNAGFPTSGLAVVAFPGSLTEAAPGSGYLEALLTPGDR